jgi:hypothetical protein
VEIMEVIGGGVEGNHRLTAATGLVLLVLLAVEGVTVLSVRAMFTVHAFVGLLLIPPIALKLASTGYRFVRYYTGNPRYRAAGPPSLIPRVTAPFLVVLTTGLFGTGVALLLTGPHGRDTWRGLHSVFFFFWFWAMSIHVLVYLWRTPDLARKDFAVVHHSHTPLAGAMTRRSLLLASVILGVVVAVAAIPWDTAWVNWFSTVHRLG